VVNLPRIPNWRERLQRKDKAARSGECFPKRGTPRGQRPPQVVWLIKS